MGHIWNLESSQPRPHGLLGVQNGGLEKTKANSESHDSKNIENFDCFQLALNFVIGYFKVT